MAPKKKTSSMIWVVKSKQSAKPAAEKKMPLDCSSLIECLPKIAQPAKTLSAPVPDWSLLPEELLHLISEKLGDSFDAAIHARSVCRPWRSAFPFPSRLLLRIAYSLPSFDYLSRRLWRSTYSRPSFDKFSRKSRDFCTLQNFPVFLFVSRAPASSHSEFFIGGIVRENHAELSSPIQCSVKVKMPWSDPTSINMRDYQIIPLGHQYAMVGYDRNSLASRYRAVAFLPLTMKGGGREFVVLLAYSYALLVLTSAEMRWKQLRHGSHASCSDLFTFRGRFYVDFLNGDIFVIDPYSLEMTPLMPPPLELQDCGISNYLVPSGNDELFLVEKIIPRNTRVLRLGRLVCRVSRLDEETGEWVVVSDLGDRILLIGFPGNRTCSAKDLPDGCGVSGNSMLFTGQGGRLTYPYKYGVDTRHEEDYLDLNFWRPTMENPVTILSASPDPVCMNSPVVSLRIKH